MANGYVSTAALRDEDEKKVKEQKKTGASYKGNAVINTVTRAAKSSASKERMYTEGAKRRTTNASSKNTSTKSTGSKSTSTKSAGTKVVPKNSAYYTEGAKRRQTNIDRRTGTNTSRIAPIINTPTYLQPKKLTTEQNKAMTELQANSLKWWQTQDQNERASLKARNDVLREQLGLAYEKGGTYDPKTGESLSTVTRMLYGKNKISNQAKSYDVDTFHKNVVNDAVNTVRQSAHQTINELYSRPNEAWSDQDTQRLNAARKMLSEEMQTIMRHYGLTYSARSTGPNARFTVSDKDALEKLREAGADQTTLDYVSENIRMREAADRFGQGLEAAGKRFIGGIPALAETSQQHSENVAESRKNPEYVQLEQQEQQLEAQLTSMQPYDVDGKPTAEYMDVYNQLQHVRDRLNQLSVETPVDQTKWGQTMLREANQAQANATAGLATVPRFLANTGISIAGNAPTMALSAVPGVGTALGAFIMGANAAGQRAWELNVQGVSPGEALGRGIASGIIEAVTEKIPLDSMAEILQSGGTSAVRNILSQMGTEASEETVSTFLNYVSDLAAQDPNAELSFEELVQSALGGALSGLTFGAIGTTASRNNLPESYQSSGTNAAGNAMLQEQSSALLADYNNRPEMWEYVDNTVSTGRNNRIITPRVYYGSENGQISSTLPTGYLPAGRSPQTSIGEVVTDVQTYPRLSVDDGGVSNNGITDTTAKYVQELFNTQQRSGIRADQIANEIVQPVTEEYNNILSSAEQYMRDYNGQGSVVYGTDEYGRGGYRASQNEPWYSAFYQQNGRAPRQSEIPALAVQTVNSEIQRGGGQFVTPEFAQTFRDAQNIQQAANILGSDALRVQNTQDGLQVTRGTPARTADIRSTNAGMNYVSEPTYNPTTTQQNRIAPIIRTASNGTSNQAARVTPSVDRVTPTVQTANPSVGAADYNFDPYTRMANEYGTIAQGEAPRARDVDVPLSTYGSDRVRRFARTAMEAEATPEQMIPDFEQNVANGLFSYNPIKNKDSLNKAVKTIGEKGFDGALAQWEDVTSGRRTATADDIVLAEMMYSTAAKNGDTQLAMQLAAEIAAEGTRAGQAVQALRLLKRTTPDGKLYYIRKAVDNIQKNLDQQRGKKAPKLKIDESLANKLLNATDETQANEAIDQIYNDVASQIPATIGDRLNAWRYFAMLGNPRTHIRNVIGNIVFQIPTRVSNKISAVAQKFLPQDQRTRSVTRNSAAKDFAKADYDEMKNVISGNAYTSEMSEVQQRQRIYPKPLQKVMDLDTKALDVEDLFFKRMTYINSLSEYLTARGVDVNNIDANTLEQARTHAIEDAMRATFQDASALADAIGKIENKNKVTKLAIGGLLPFKRTPINIAKRGFEYSPAGLIKSMTYDIAQVKKGKMSATDFIDDVSQGLTGTSIAVIGYFLASSGLISASSPENDKERNFEAAQGSQEYALNIGDTSYTIDWAAPGALPLFIGAEFYNAMQQKYGDDEQVFKQATDSLSRLFEPMINMTMLSGLSSTLQSASYSQTNPLFSIAGNVVSNYAGQVVPTLAGQIARTIDDTRRTTYADKDSWVPDSVQTFLQRQANKIPGLSQKQPAYTDVWGREDKTDNVLLRAFENFLSPGYISSTDTSETEKALSDLYNLTGDTAVLPSKPQKYYTENGKKTNLTANQWLKLSNQKGSISLDALNNLFQSSAYQKMSDQEKINAVKDIYDYASQVSANSVYGKELEGTIKTIHDSGIDPGLYYAYKEKQDTLNETLESYAARDEVFQTIRGDASLSDDQKNALYETLLMKGTSDSQYENYQEIKDVVSAEEYVDAMIQSQAIKAYGDDLESGRATAEATEFSYYLDTMGYTGEKRDALENTFKFYNMFPAEPSNYTFDMLRENGSNNEKDNASAIESSGVTAPQYLAIKSLASDAQYTKGETGAKLRAYAKVVSENTETYEQYAAIMHAMGYKKIEDAYTGAGTLPEATAVTSQVSRTSSTPSFVNPTKAANSVVTSNYGNRSAPKTSGGWGSTNHRGIDIGGTGGNLNGQEADTIGSGTVETVGNDPNGYGNYVIVDHGNGYKTLYGHLQKATVQQGQQVSAGQQIGIIGSTGNSSAPHLHLSAWYNDEAIDPLTIIPGY